MMNQEDLFKKIGLILNELNTQYDFLAQNPQLLNELELALFHANADFLSDHAKILIKVTASQLPLEIQAGEKELPQVEDRSEKLEADYYGDSFEEEQQQIETIAFVDEEIFKPDHSPSGFEFILSDHSAEEAEMQIEIPVENNERFEFEEKSVDELFNRPLSQEEENILAQKRKLIEPVIVLPIETEADDDEIGPEPFLVAAPSKQEVVEPIVPEPIVSEPVISEPVYKPTLNDLLAAKADKSLNDNRHQITDLKQGVNLNDKLLYVKDLFNGYNLAYAEAIDLANKLPNFEAADTFFKKNYAIKNNWAEKQATVDKFYTLLNQRFK